MNILSALNTRLLALNLCRFCVLPFQNGIIVLHTNEYYIEPISVHANYRSNDGVPHALYKRSWLKLPDKVNDDLLISYDDTWKKEEDTFCKSL